MWSQILTPRSFRFCFASIIGQHRRKSCEIGGHARMFWDVADKSQTHNKGFAKSWGLASRLCGSSSLGRGTSCSVCDIRRSESLASKPVSFNPLLQQPRSRQSPTHSKDTSWQVIRASQKPFCTEFDRLRKVLACSCDLNPKVLVRSILWSLRLI